MRTRHAIKNALNSHARTHKHAHARVLINICIQHGFSTGTHLFDRRQRLHQQRQRSTIETRPARTATAATMTTTASVRPISLGPSSAAAPTAPPALSWTVTTWPCQHHLLSLTASTSAADVLHLCGATAAVAEKQRCCSDGDQRLAPAPTAGDAADDGPSSPPPLRRRCRCSRAAAAAGHSVVLASFNNALMRLAHNVRQRAAGKLLASLVHGCGGVSIACPPPSP